MARSSWHANFGGGRRRRRPSGDSRQVATGLQTSDGTGGEKRPPQATTLACPSTREQLSVHDGGNGIPSNLPSARPEGECKEEMSPGMERPTRHEVEGGNEGPTGLEGGGDTDGLLGPAHFGLGSCYGTMIW